MLSFSTKCSKHKPSPLPSDPQSPLSLSLTHTHPQTRTHQHTQPRPSPHLTPHDSLYWLCRLPLQLLTDFLVFLQSRKASEQAKSVDSKTDSIGSGRAIPIKQVSGFPHFFYHTFLVVPWVSMTPCGSFDVLFSLMLICCVLKIYTVGPALTCGIWSHVSLPPLDGDIIQRTRQLERSCEVEKKAGV